MELIREIEGDTSHFYMNEKEVFWLKEEIVDQGVIATIGGELLSEITNEFLDEMLALVSVGMNIVIDFEKVSYMSTSFMKALLKIQLTMDKKDKGQMLVLRKIPKEIMNEFEATGTSELLMIE